MTQRFKELVFKMPDKERELMKSAAAKLDMEDDMEEAKAVSLCRLHFPELSFEEAHSFLRWLNEERRRTG